MLFITSFGGDSDEERTVHGPSLPNTDKIDKWSVFIVVFLGTIGEQLHKNSHHSVNCHFYVNTFVPIHKRCIENGLYGLSEQ